MSVKTNIFVPDEKGDYFYQIFILADTTQVKFVIRQYDQEDGLMVQSAPGPKFQRFKHD